MSMSPSTLSRRALLTGFTLGGLSLLIACSGKAPSAAPASPAASSNGSTATTSTSPTPASAPAAQAQPANASGKVVDFWIPWGQPERQSWTQKWGKAFSEKYPDQGFKTGESFSRSQRPAS